VTWTGCIAHINIHFFNTQEGDVGGRTAKLATAKALAANFNKLQQIGTRRLEFIVRTAVANKD